MPAITFVGDVSNATGAVTILSVSGQNGFSFSKSYSGTFSETLALENGIYVVIVVCMTDGECEFDIQGQFQDVVPGVPRVFDKDDDSESFSLTV